MPPYPIFGTYEVLYMFGRPKYAERGMRCHARLYCNGVQMPLGGISILTAYQMMRAAEIGISTTANKVKAAKTL